MLIALADKEVVGVVRGRDLHDAGAELAVDVVVGDDGDLAAGERQDDGLADEVRIAVVLGVHCDRGVAGKSLGTRRRDHHVVLVGLALDALLAPHDGIAHVPEVAVVGLVLDLVVGERRATARAPVDDVVALVDEPLVVELGEDLGDGAGAALVEGKALAPPVGGVAEHALLVDDRPAVLALPLPHALEELLAPEVLAALALLLERLLDDVLRRDAGVVRVRLTPVRVLVETSVLLPELVPLGLRGLRVVVLVHKLSLPSAGGPGGTRTHYPLLRRQLLCPDELQDPL